VKISGSRRKRDLKSTMNTLKLKNLGINNPLDFTHSSTLKLEKWTTIRKKVVN